MAFNVSHVLYCANITLYMGKTRVK